MTQGQAKLVVSDLGWIGDARVYELDPPMDGHTYVIVSAVVAYISGPETYIFPAKKIGDVFEAEDMLEMDGSFQGGLDHELALDGAGYEVVT